MTEGIREQTPICLAQSQEPAYHFDRKKVEGESWICSSEADFTLSGYAFRTWISICSIGITFGFDFSIWAIPGGVQGLLLHSEIISSGLRPCRVTQDWTHVDCVRQMPKPLCTLWLLNSYLYSGSFLTEDRYITKGYKIGILENNEWKVEDIRQQVWNVHLETTWLFAFSWGYGVFGNAEVKVL